jgi:hypothetical protein
MSQVFIMAVSALRAEMAMANGHTASFEREQPLRELMNAGLSPSDAEKALEEAEEYLDVWDQKAPVWRSLQQAKRRSF